MPAPKKNQKGRDERAENPLMVILGDKSSKEEKQEEAKQQRKNFVETQKNIVKNMGDRIKKMTKSIVRAITGKSSFLSKALKLLAVLLPTLLLRASERIKSILDFGEVGFRKLGVFFETTLPNIISKIDAFIDVGKTRFLKLIENIKPAIVKRFQAIFAAIKESKIGKVFANIFKKLEPVFDFFRKIFDKIKPVGTFLANIFQRIRKIGGGAGRFLTTIGKFFGTVGRVLKPVLNIVSKVAKFLKAVPILGQVITVIEGIVGFFRGFFGTEGSFFDKLIGGVKGIFAQIISGLTFGLLSFDDVMGFFDTVIDSISWFFGAAYDFFAETIPSIWNSAVDAIMSFFNAIWEFYTVTVPSFYGKVFDAIIYFFTDTIPNFFTVTIPEFFMSLASKVIEYVNLAGDLLYDVFVQPWITIGNFVADMFTKAKNFILEGLIGLVNTFNYGGVLDSAIETLQGFKTQADVPSGTSSTYTLDPVAIQEKVSKQLSRVADQARDAIAKRDEIILNLQKQLADKVTGAVNVINTVTNTTAYPTDSEPAGEVDPTLRRAVQPMPY